jgi:hypothetical protein
MQPGYTSDFAKHTYIGAPVKAIAHPCPVCKKGPKDCHCKGKCAPAPMGICAAVLDDANHRVYLYGNIVHENYHIPGNNCVAYTAVESAGFLNGRIGADEWFDGVQDNNNIGLAHVPFHDNSLLVFLNGVKQREGNEYDYTINENVIHFNFYQLMPNDRVEVMYEYGAE